MISQFATFRVRVRTLLLEVAAEIGASEMVQELLAGRDAEQRQARQGQLRGPESPRTERTHEKTAEIYPIPLSLGNESILEFRTVQFEFHAVRLQRCKRVCS